MILYNFSRGDLGNPMHCTSSQAQTTCHLVLSREELNTWEWQKATHLGVYWFSRVIFPSACLLPQFLTPCYFFHCRHGREKKKCGDWYILVGIVHIGALSKIFYFHSQCKSAHRTGEFFCSPNGLFGQKLTNIQLNFEIVIQNDL